VNRNGSKRSHVIINRCEHEFCFDSQIILFHFVRAVLSFSLSFQFTSSQAFQRHYEINEEENADRRGEVIALRADMVHSERLRVALQTELDSSRQQLAAAQLAADQRVRQALEAARAASEAQLRRLNARHEAHAHGLRSVQDFVMEQFAEFNRRLAGDIAGQFEFADAVAADESEPDEESDAAADDSDEELGDA
jgi:hypothetical protein